MVAERITHNSYLEHLPDHTGPRYNGIHILMINIGMAEEEAAEILNISWTRLHEERIGVNKSSTTLGSRKNSVDLLKSKRIGNIPKWTLNRNRSVERSRRSREINDFDEDAMVDNFISGHDLPHPMLFDGWRSLIT